MPVTWTYKDKPYQFDNAFHAQIVEFTLNKDFAPHDEEVIDFALNLKDDLITRLSFDNPTNDSIICEYINWIEENYIKDSIKFHIEQSLEIPSRINNYTFFNYSEDKRNKVKKNPIVPKKIPISTKDGENIVHADGI